MGIHEIEIAAWPDSAAGDIKKTARKFFHFCTACDNG